ncbi:MAG TPA: AAA family ATPase [Caulobacteraceae bacterium]
MDRYERFWLRKYALRALKDENGGRVRRPVHRLASWLVENAEELGVPEPKIDASAFDLDAGRIDRETWAAFSPVLAELNKAGAVPARSALELRLTWLCETLDLPTLESDILRLCVRASLDKTLQSLLKSFECFHGTIAAKAISLLTDIGERFVRQALQASRPLLLLGLLEDQGCDCFVVSNTVLRIARLNTCDPTRLRSLLVGKPRKAELAWEDFAHLGENAELAERMVSGALAKRAAGVNLLLYGPPGTGKTEFVRTLAERVGAHPMFVGEDDEDGGEPTRKERVAAFAVARALASRAGRTLLAVDEADDIFTGVDDRDYQSRAGSKVFMNRLVERTAVPTIWITNHANQLGGAVLRRMSLAVRFPEPGRHVRRRVVQRIASRRRLRLSPAALDDLAEVRAAPAVIDLAVRAARLTGGREADAREAALSVIRGMGRTPVPAPPASIPFDPALSAADCDLAILADRVAASGERAISFCLHGLPGTGKSAFARHVAERIGLDVIEKRASDLISMWVGETEQQIARAFEEAADLRAMLILDEADSFLRDRAGASRSWEVTQVNEMLTWMERHPYPFACATNLMDSLDPATLRRFLFKVKFLPMTAEQAREAFRRSFGATAPATLDRLDNLAPGDFALVARKARLLGEDGEEDLVAMLGEEVALKRGGGRTRIGFSF